jgi:hypothetical protein
LSAGRADRVGGSAHRRGHERRAGDDEAEREEAGADLEGAGADRLDWVPDNVADLVEGSPAVINGEVRVQA